MQKCGRVGVAAVRAGMSRNTATKYLATDKLPSELRSPRTWRTRSDPFAGEWPRIVERLREAPDLEAKAVLDELMRQDPARYGPGHLRTLQRRFKRWRAESGPEKELFFPQDHRPGEAMQTDFTSMRSLGITIAGEPYDHLLCHPVLPYSGWSWGTPCRSESMAALKKGVQAALLQLGHVPEFHQTDNSTAATHRLETGKRAFNDEYLELMRHVGMKPRTIQIGKKQQTGPVEATHGAVKRHIEQQLLLRGSRDFASHEEYQRWLRGIFERRNAGRAERLAREIAVMQPLLATPLPEYTEAKVRVTPGGTIRVKRNTYSVPSRLKDEWVRVRIYDDRLEVYLGDRLQMSVERLHGKTRHRINYRHIVHSMLRKPGALRRYRFRDDLLPSPPFREAFEALDAHLPERRADIEYLRILELAATTMESAVEQALVDLLRAGAMPTADAIRQRVAPVEARVPELTAVRIDLASYDALLEQVEEVFA